MTLRSAMHRSVNTVFVRLMQDVGPAETVALANRLGLEIPEIDPARDGSGLSISLGSREVSGLGMASAYGTFANDGVRVAPTPVVRVFAPDGSLVLDRSEPAGEQVLKEATADNVTDVLEGVITSGTAAGQGHPPPGCGQDRHDPGQPRLLVRRLHPDPLRIGVHGLGPAAAAGRQLPGEGSRPHRRLVPGRSVAALHARRAAGRAHHRLQRAGAHPRRGQRGDPARAPGFAPRTRMSGCGTGAGGPYLIDADGPVAPAPSTTTSSTSTSTSTSTTTTTAPGRGIFDPDDD